MWHTNLMMIDRLMPVFIRTACKKQGIAVTSFSDDWLFELSKDGRTAHVIGYSFGLNSAVAAKIAQDKVAAYELLKYHNVPAVEHRLIRTNTDWLHWPWSDGWVMKPLLGSSGNSVGMVHSSEAALNWMSTHGNGAWAASPFLDIVREIRVIVLDGRVLLTYEKIPVMINGLKMFNLGKGATPRDVELSAKIGDIAKNAMKVTGLRLAAVDIVELPTGEFRVLEVNDGFAVKNYASFSTANREKVDKLYDTIIAAMFA